MRYLSLAFDKESVREYDKDGRLKVARTPISAAMVCEYLSEEIPGWQELGLTPGKRYKLLRDPEELKKAAETSNNIPLLDKHIPIDAYNHAENADNVAGGTGSEAEFKDDKLYNSLGIWPREAITDVETGGKRQLSAAYHYRPDMIPGKYKGESYDGVMRDIKFNHVALVENGRCGPDVCVMDEALFEPESEDKPQIKFDCFYSKKPFRAFY